MMLSKKIHKFRQTKGLKPLHYLLFIGIELSENSEVSDELFYWQSLIP